MRTLLLFRVRINYIMLQVSNPLRASITGAPLEDARHLTRRCERLRQEVESQVLLISVHVYCGKPRYVARVSSVAYTFFY